MTPASLNRCWANVPTRIGDAEPRCHSRVNPRDELGLCQPCKRRLQDESQVSVPERRISTDRPNTPRARRWAEEAGLM